MFSVLAALRTALFWTDTAVVVPEICWSRTLPKFGSQNPYCSYYHGDHFGLHLSHLFEICLRYMVYIVKQWSPTLFVEIYLSVDLISNQN